jgi:hypothetical protein
MLDDDRTEVDVQLFADYVRARARDASRGPPLRYSARSVYPTSACHVISKRRGTTIKTNRTVRGRDALPVDDADVRWRLLGVSGMELSCS